ncbi:MAG: glutamate synthase-related protein [Glaciecola sp.]
MIAANITGRIRLNVASIIDEIALIRGIKKGEDCVSPAVNPECDTPLALLEFVQQLRTLANGKPIGIKLCIGNPAEFLCLGMMCIEGTYLVHNALLGLGIRDKITVIAAGKTATGFDILNKLAYGADVVNAARTFMLALGCIQSRHCDSNKCPTGIATQDKNRSKAINVELKSQRVASFQKLTLKSCYDLVGSMGLDDMTKLTQSMIKVRMPNGLLDANSLSDFVLEHKELIRQCPEGMWDTWWQQASSHSFQIEP